MKIPPLSLSLCSSVWILLYLVLLHLLLAIAIGFWVQSIVGYVLLIMVLLLSAVGFVRRYSRFGNYYGIRRVSYKQPFWLLDNGNEQRVVNLKTATVLPFLIVMVFRCQYSKRRYDLVLFPDSVDKDLFRRLRIMLKHMPVYNSVK